jgi:hypothetical protein
MQAETSKYWDTRSGAILNLEGFKYTDLHLCITEQDKSVLVGAGALVIADGEFA